MTLREARRALDWTQPRLAEKSGVPQQQISELERGETKRPSYDSVTRILAALHAAGLRGVTADELFPALAAQKAKAS